MKDRLPSVAIIMHATNEKHYLIHFPGVSPGAHPLTKKTRTMETKIDSVEIAAISIERRGHTELKDLNLQIQSSAGSASLWHLERNFFSSF